MLRITPHFMLPLCQTELDGNGKFTSLTFFALHTDGAAHGLYDISGNRKPQSHTRSPAGNCSMLSLKRIKDKLQKFFIDTNTCIPHLEYIETITFRGALGFGKRNADLSSGRREFQCIAYKVH